jgi:hypothetical protein
VSVIAFISLAGITIGTFTSSVALCVMSGFEIDVRGRQLAFTPQVNTEIAKPMLEVAGGPMPSFDECGEVDFGIDPNSPCAGVFSAEPCCYQQTLPQRA